jgi:hypothetical protein
MGNSGLLVEQAEWLRIIRLLTGASIKPARPYNRRDATLRRFLPESYVTAGTGDSFSGSTPAARVHHTLPLMPVVPLVPVVPVVPLVSGSALRGFCERSLCASGYLLA